MKIAIVHSFYRAELPSGENFTVEMQVEALAGTHHDVRLISQRTDEAANSRLYPAIKAVNVATGHGPSPLAAIREFKPDIVHVHNLFPNYSTKWLEHWNGPIVATLHNFRPLCSNGLLFRDGHPCTLCPSRGHHHAVIHKCYRDSRLATLPLAISNRKGPSASPLLNETTRLIALSNRSRNTYITHGVAPDKISVIPNFIHDITESPKARINNDKWMYAGRLTAEKGIVDLVSRWPAHEELLIAGSGPQADLIEHLVSLNDNITFLGALSRPDLLESLNLAKGLVIPSLCAENLPTVYLEALAAGRPVIARLGNSAADDVSSWAPELTFANTSELEQTLHYARLHWFQLAKKARDQYISKFTRQAWITNIEQLYSEAERARRIK